MQTGLQRQVAQLRRLYEQTRAQLQTSERERAVLAAQLARRPIAERLYGEGPAEPKAAEPEELGRLRAQLAEAVVRLRDMTEKNRALLDGQRVLEETARASAEKEKNAREALEAQLAGELTVVDRFLGDQERLATENEELRARVLDLQREVFAAREAANAATAARDARAREAADLRLRLQETQIRLNEAALAGQGMKTAAAETVQMASPGDV